MDQSKNDLKQQALNYLRTICKPYAPIGIAITGPDQRHQLDDGSSYTTFWNENQSTLHLIYYSSIGSTKYKTFTLPPPKKTLPLHRQYWQAGFTIIPLKGKRPIHPNWQTTPYQTESDLLQLESEGLGNFGVLCQGWLIIDIDARNGGVESYQKLLQQLPELQHSGFIVKTGSGGGSQHIYYALPSSVPKLKSKHSDYPGIDFKTTGQVVGAGSIHPETKQPYEIEHGSPSTITEAPSRLIELLKREELSSQPKPMPKMVSTGDRTPQIIAMLEQINPDVGYEDWIRIGMGIHHETYGSETGYEIWYTWSSQGTKFKAKEMRSKWKSFSGGGVTFGTLISLAKAHGYVPTTLSCNNFQPVEKTVINQSPLHHKPTSSPSRSVQEEVDLENHPILKNVKGIDLTRPPGFVGEVAEWIDSQSVKPRKELAAACAIATVGNIGGVSVTDDGWSPYDIAQNQELITGRTSPNIFLFGVAESGTGKEAILQSAMKILGEVGLGPCIGGRFKSEQEVGRNVLEHQPVFYYLDEFGSQLTSVSNATKKGVTYLDNLIGTLMSIYSKSTGRFFLDRDVRREFLKKIDEEILRIEKHVKKNGDEMDDKSKQQIDRLRDKKKSMDNGINKPYLSIFGVTTPSTFDALVERENVTNGFMGRAIIIREMDTNPKSRRRHCRLPFSPRMFNTFNKMMARCDLTIGEERIEAKKEQIIPSDQEALEYLSDIEDYFYELGESQVGTTGLEAITARGREQVQKISLTLALENGQRTWEHVNWAFALVLRDIQTKINLALSNDDGDSAIELKVLERLRKAKGKPIGLNTILDRERTLKNKEKDVQRVLDKLQGEGVIKGEISKKNTVIYSIY